MAAKVKGKRPNVEYVPMKRCQWITGEEADMEEDNIENEMFTLDRNFMSASLLRKHPGKSSNLKF
jgi:hypothetical protein